MSLASGLQECVDEKRTAGKLLNEQITRGFARCDLLAFRDVLDQQSGFLCIELFEVQHVEQFEVRLCIVGGFDELTA